MSHLNHAFTDYYPLAREGLTVVSRRNMLKAGDLVSTGATSGVHHVVPG